MYASVAVRAVHSVDTMTTAAHRCAPPPPPPCAIALTICVCVCVCRCSDCNLTAPQVQALAKAVTGGKHLKCFDISRASPARTGSLVPSRFSGLDATFACDAGNPDVGDAGMASVVDMARSTPSLEIVNFSGGPSLHVLPPSVPRLLVLHRRCPCVVSPGCGLGPTSATACAAWLNTKPKLKSCSFGGAVLRRCTCSPAYGLTALSPAPLRQSWPRRQRRVGVGSRLGSL